MSRGLRALGVDDRAAVEAALARREGEVARQVGSAMRDAALSLPSVSILRDELLESAADYLTFARLRGVPVPAAELVAPARSD